MVRSVWKGPFVEASLLKKADVARASGRHDTFADGTAPATATGAIVTDAAPPVSRKKAKTANQGDLF